MRALVTGGAGFIGHHLVARLLDDGYEVVVLDNLHRGSFERPELIGATLLRGDVRDDADCLGAASGCDLAFHLAAQSNVMGSQVDPDYTFATNVTGTWNVARAAQASGAQRMVFASSREVYGNQTTLPVDEGRALTPRNLYGASKVAAEAVLRCLPGRSPVVSVLRLSNVIGTGDSGRVVPLWLAAARAGAPLVLYGGDQVMDFVPVGIAVEALVRAAEIRCGIPPTNVGSGHPTTLRHLAARILEGAAPGSDLQVMPSREAEVTTFTADVSRMRSVLGIEPPSDPLVVLPRILEAIG